jgi:4-amino-4-deoxy-L-arabinose transferase-like glycosyltransferase
MVSPLSTLGSAWPADRGPGTAAAAIPGRWWLPLIIGVALVVRLAALWASAGMELQIVDEQHYHQFATSLAHGDGFAWGPSQPTSIRPPLYPMVVAAIWRVTGTDSIEAVRGVQVALGVLSVWLLYLLGVRLFDRGTATLAALALAVYPSLLFSGVLLLTEVFFIVLVLTALIACAALLRRPTWWAALATGAAFGLAALTRSVLWPFPFVLAGFLGLTLRVAVRDRLKICGLLLLGYALVVAPWSVRNTRLQGTFTAIDTMGGLNLLMGNYEHTPEDRMWDAVSITGAQSWDAPLRRLPPPAGGWTEGTKDRWAQRRAFEFMAMHPLVTARRSLLKFGDLWGLEREWLAGVQQGLYGTPAWFAVVSGAAVLAGYPAILILALAGLFLATPTERPVHALLVLVILFVCAIHSITFGHSRYHLPLMPILMLYAAAALRQRSGILERLRTRAVIAPAFAVSVAVLIWSREVLVRDSEHIASLIRVLRYGA